MLRALSHVIYACVGALIIIKMPDILRAAKKITVFALFIGLLHAVCEVAVVTLFYFGTDMLPPTFYENGFFTTVFLLVGVGTVIHSCVDFMLALGIWKVIPNRK